MTDPQEVDRWLEAARLFGDVLESDTIGFDEYRDVSELPASEFEIARGIIVMALRGLPIDDAVQSLGALSQYHEGVGARVKGSTALIGEIFSGSDHQGALQSLNQGDRSKAEEILEATRSALNSNEADERRAAMWREQSRQKFEVLCKILKDFLSPDSNAPSSTAPADASRSAASAVTKSGGGCLGIVMAGLLFPAVVAIC